MDAHHVERVVDAEAVLQFQGAGARRTGQDADRNGTHRGDHRAGGGDANQACDDAGGGAEAGGVPVADAFDRKPGQHRRGGSDQGVDPGQARQRAGGQGRTGIETEPAEPQQASAKHHQGEVVRTHRGATETDARSHDQRQGQSGRAGIDVDGRATGEVEGLDGVGDPAPVFCDVAVEGEDPVGGGEVAQHRPRGRKCDPRAELHPVGDRAGDQRDRDDGEGGLEAGEDEKRDLVALSAHGDVIGAAQASELQGVADQAVPGLAKGHREAEQHPQHADDAHGDHGHQHHVEHALGAHHPAVEEGEGGGHQQHHRGADQHPRGVTGVDV